MTVNPDSIEVSKKAPVAILFDDELNEDEFSLFRFIINKNYNIYQFKPVIQN
jgi:hypothetical protein